MPRFLATLAVFAVLSLLAMAAVRVMPLMLNQGVWMNPFVILAGFFIDSYQASLEKLAADGSEHQSARTYPPCGRDSWWLEFVGACAEGKALITRTGLKAIDCATLSQTLRRLILYWSVVAYALYLAFVK